MAKKQDDYFELLKHPKWQEKRLRIMERDGFECRVCGDKDRTLNVHHRYYLKGHKPWEYPDEHLVCFCEPCHEREHERQEELKVLIAEWFATGSGDIDELIGYVKGKILQGRDGPDDRTRFPVRSYEEASGLADSYGLMGNEGVITVTNAASRSEDGALTHAVLMALLWEQIDESRAQKHLQAPTDSPEPDHEWQRSALRA